MTYPKWRLEDYQLLEIMSVAEREGALVMVHAENDDMIRWIAKRLVERGHGAPKFHGVAHDALAEAEATHRIIMLSRLLGAPVLIVHVSSPEATNTIRAAQTLGARIYAETCPQYLVLTAEDMDRPGVEGAKWCCSPPLRDKAAQEAIWTGLDNGTFQVYSSDHAPYRFDETAKIPRGEQTTFKEMANGVPGIEMRLPILFSEGVLKQRPHHQSIRRARRDQPCAHVRPVSAQRHDRSRLRRRPRHLGSRDREAHRLLDDARRGRLHALRGPRVQGLAADRAEPRPRGRRRRRTESRTRLGAVPCARRAGARWPLRARSRVPRAN
jgi:hypothetical protein